MNNPLELWLNLLRNEQFPKGLSDSTGQLGGVVEVDRAASVLHFGDEGLREASSFPDRLLRQPSFFAGFLEISGENKPLRRRWFVRRI